MTRAEVAALWSAARPYQWTKNLLVLAAVLFSGKAFVPAKLAAAVYAAGLFCVASSAAYLLNDLRDVGYDRRHAAKRRRPLASGELRCSTAWFACALLTFAAAAGSLALPPMFRLFLGCYLLFNAAYSCGLKDVALLDVLIIAGCFVLRAVAGAFAIESVPSPWLALCTMMLALLVALGKRRHELHSLEGAAESHRASLGGYTAALLDQLMAVSAAGALVTYSIYTLSEETVHRLGSRALLFSVPFVVYGVFRYLALVHTRHEGGDPAKLFATDRPTLCNLFFWCATVIGVVYGGLSLPNW